MKQTTTANSEVNQTPEKKTTLPAGITQEMVNAAKEKYGETKIRIAELPKGEDSDEVLPVLLRVPNRQIRNEFSKWMDKSPGKSEDILVNGCLLSHKDEVKANEEMFASAVDAIAQLMTVNKATIKKI